MNITFDGSQIAGGTAMTSGIGLMANTSHWWLGLVLICVGTFIPAVKVSFKRKSRFP